MKRASKQAKSLLYKTVLSATEKVEQRKTGRVARAAVIGRAPLIISGN